MQDSTGQQTRQLDRGPDKSGEQLMRANGVDLCVQTFGDPAHAPLLLIGGTGCSMDYWDDRLCERLADGARFVIRYDHRDTGRSVSYAPGVPPYTLRDLTADAVGVLDGFALDRAHVVGMSMGGWIAQLMALDYGRRVASLTLIATRGTAHGPSDADLPEMTAELQAALSHTAEEPDWSDRAAVIDYLVAGERPFAGSLPFDEVARRAVAGRVFDRSANLAASLTNHVLIDGGERWRERLSTVAAPTLIIHGSEDPLFPVGNARALQREIPGAGLLLLAGVGHETPPRATWDTVIPAMLRHTAKT